MGCVFAQLIIENKRYGVHPFLVKLRENGQPCPGITIKDCGLKEGLNGYEW
jgi:acyl-CoA oxidase